MMILSAHRLRTPYSDMTTITDLLTRVNLSLRERSDEASFASSPLQLISSAIPGRMQQCCKPIEKTHKKYAKTRLILIRALRC